MSRRLPGIFAICLIAALDAAAAQSPTPPPSATQAPPAADGKIRPIHPTRDPHTPGYVKAKELPELKLDSKVDVWFDASGKARDLRAPDAKSSPVWTKVSGTPVMRFDGVDDCLRLIDQKAELDSFTIFLVAIPRANAALPVAAAMDPAMVMDGTEALSVMRIEKGHVAGNELNGQTVARDLGLGRMMSSKKDYIGRTMAARPALVDPERPTLVGLRPVDRADRLRGGAHLLTIGAAPTPEADEGYVTSTAFSPSLGHWIGLGLLSRGPELTGERIRVYDPLRSEDFAAEIVSPVFIDPEGVRLRG